MDGYRLRTIDEGSCGAASLPPLRKQSRVIPPVESPHQSSPACFQAASKILHRYSSKTYASSSFNVEVSY